MSHRSWQAFSRHLQGEIDKDPRLLNLSGGSTGRGGLIRLKPPPPPQKVCRLIGITNCIMVTAIQLMRLFNNAMTASKICGSTKAKMVHIWSNLRQSLHTDSLLAQSFPMVLTSVTSRFSYLVRQCLYDYLLIINYYSSIENLFYINLQLSSLELQYLAVWF